MKLARRRFGRIVLGATAVGICGLSAIGTFRTVPLPINVSLFPSLTRLVPLYADDAACERIASALSPAARAELLSSGIARAEQGAARAFAERQAAVRRVLRACLADDFRSGRTVQARGFRLAQTEAALVLLRRAIVHA